MNKVFILTDSYGEYEDHHEYIERVFLASDKNNLNSLRNEYNTYYKIEAAVIELWWKTLTNSERKFGSGYKGKEKIKRYKNIFSFPDWLVKEKGFKDMEYEQEEL